jgi:redox-sensitive bicupin YhaK (pirin superfamily)
MFILSHKDYAVLGEADFGTPGLQATELIGPFVELQAVGPLIMVHDAIVEPNLGIGHHPHRYNERLFYILEGSLSHDDALNGITGFMGKGDVARLTEGETGMLHKEWNDTGERTHAFILVYETRPVPERASFAALRDLEAPRYEEAPGVETKELVGPRAGLTINGEIRLFTDSWMAAGSHLNIDVGPGDGALLYVLEGKVLAGEGAALAPGIALIVPPGYGDEIPIEAHTDVRLLRAVVGPGRGVLRGRPMVRRGA